MGRTSGLTPLKAVFGGQLTPQGVGTHGVEAFGRSGTHKGGWGLTLSRSGTHKGRDAGIMYIINFKKYIVSTRILAVHRILTVHRILKYLYIVLRILTIHRILTT